MEVLYYSEKGKAVRRTTVDAIDMTFCSDSETRVTFTDRFGEHVWIVYPSLSYNIKDLLKESPVNFLGLTYKPVDIKAAPTQEAASKDTISPGEEFINRMKELENKYDVVMYIQDGMTSAFYDVVNKFFMEDVTGLNNYDSSTLDAIYHEIERATSKQGAASNSVNTSVSNGTLTPDEARNIVVWYMHLSSSARAYAEHSYAAFASACKSCESANAERCHYFLSSWSKHEIDEIMEDVKRNTRLPDSVLN